MPGDKHLAENGRTRCAEHYAKRRAAIKARSDAKAAGVDVSGPGWEPPGPSKRERPSPTTVLPPQLWADAADAHEALYEASGPLYEAVNRGTGLSPEDLASLKDALTASMLANEQVLYGPGRAPRDAAGPPTDRVDLSSAPGAHDRHFPDQGPAVDPAQVRHRTTSAATRCPVPHRKVPDELIPRGRAQESRTSPLASRDRREEQEL